MLSSDHRAALENMTPPQLVWLARSAIANNDPELATAAILLLPRRERRRVREVLEREGRA